MFFKKKTQSVVPKPTQPVLEKFQQAIRDLQVKGCLEPDIVALLEVFAKEIDQVNAAIQTLIKVPDDYVRMSELSTVIDKCEVIVDSDLGTLKSFIQTKNLLKIDLPLFYDQVIQWSENVWQERKLLAEKQAQEEAEAMQRYENEESDIWDEH